MREKDFPLERQRAEQGVGLGTVGMGREITCCRGLEGQDLVSSTSREGNPWCPVRVARARREFPGSEQPRKIPRKRMAGHSVTQASFQKLPSWLQSIPLLPPTWEPYATDTEQPPAAVVALFLSLAPGWVSSPLLCKGKRQGYSSPLILSRGGKQFFQHHLLEQFQPCLEEMLKEELSIPLPLSCCQRQMHHFRKETALLPTTWSARSRGSFDQSEAICALITAFPGLCSEERAHLP